MDATVENEEMEDGPVSRDSEDDFGYKEVSAEGDRSSSVGEEDLEATVNAIRQRAEAAALLRPEPETEAVDDFLRNFLCQAGMTETLDCFQTEWAETMQKSPTDAKMRVGAVPSVYVENQRLESELKNAKRERDEYRRAASAAAHTLAGVRKARDFHRMRYTRVLQEKSRLIEEMKKLKARCDSRDPAVKRMHEKYQTVVKRSALVAAERDRALAQTSCESARNTQTP